MDKDLAVVLEDHAHDCRHVHDVELGHHVQDIGGHAVNEQNWVGRGVGDDDDDDDAVAAAVYHCHCGRCVLDVFF